MDFALTQTQADLKAAVRRYLGDRYPVARIAELADAGRHDREAWPELDRQGWLDPELGIVELALLAEESGRALHPVSWWATAGLAVPVYRAAGIGLPGPATLANGATTCRASDAGGAWRLNGRAAAVDAHAATEIVVAAGLDSGVALFGVRPDAPGVSIGEPAGIDPLRTLADLDLRHAPARLLVGPPAAPPLLADVEQRAAALLACEAVGVADRALEIAVGYAKTRVQFDRPIGSYQAVGHRLADSYADVELARSLAYRAACVLDRQAAGLDRQAAGLDRQAAGLDRQAAGLDRQAAGLDRQAGDAGEALACAVHASRRAAVSVCEAAIQVCGGIGVTWEFPLHRWYRRALWLDAFHAGRPDPLTTIAEAVIQRHDQNNYTEVAASSGQETATSV
jgi:alkylation response protein AidB-like acyl-CoA dehydrogenase